LQSRTKGWKLLGGYLTPAKALFKIQTPFADDIGFSRGSRKQDEGIARFLLIWV